MSITSWLTSSSQRIYPTSDSHSSAPPSIECARNEQFSFQVAAHNRSPLPAAVTISVESSCPWTLQVRRVGYVPVRHLNTDLSSNSSDVEGRAHIPGFVPDPLFEEDHFSVPPGETHAFWITARVDSPVPPGSHLIRVKVAPERARPQIHHLNVLVHEVILPRRSNFSISHWLYLDALMDWYKTDGFDRRFWSLLPTYLKNMTTHGLDTLYVPLITPPLDGVKRPTQLLRVHRSRSGCYRFDWRNVRRFISLAQTCGFEKFEWSHFFTQWGARHAPRIYAGQGRGERQLWPANTPATSPVYRTFLAALLPELHNFLKESDLLTCSWFHVSDEPSGAEHLKNYRKARRVLHRLASWMRVMDALSDVSLATTAVIDLPVASIHTAHEFHEAGLPAWCYYCCVPRGAYLNRLMETPLAKIAMHGFLFYRWPFRGFLHWGYNYWHASQQRALIDPFTVQDAGRWPEWAFGDPFIVYPGPDGPIDSIRWEIFGESLQDYALLQAAATDRNDPLLHPLESFQSFPKKQKWRHRARQKLFQKLRLQNRSSH